MSIRLNISSVGTAAEAYGSTADAVSERKRTLTSVTLQTAGAWQGTAARSWDVRMGHVREEILAPIETELKAVKGILEEAHRRAVSLRGQAEGFGSDLGGGADAGGQYLVDDEAYAEQVGTQAASLKEAIVAQGGVWSELEDLAASLWWGGVSLDEGLPGCLYADCEKVNAFLASYGSYRQGVAELGEYLASSLAHLDPDCEQSQVSAVAAGFCSYFGVPGTEGLKGMQFLCNILAADPVNTATGNFVYQAEEMSIPHIPPLSVVRTYNSLGKADGVFGCGWVWNWGKRLTDMKGRIELVDAGGAHKAFVARGDGRYAANIGCEEVIERTEGGYVLTDENLIRHRFARNGSYQGYTDAAGQGVGLSYDGAGRADAIESTSGARLHIEYDGRGHITGISDHTGRKAAYSYEGNLLAGFTNECGGTYTYSYDAQDNLTAIHNPRRVCVLEQAFDDRGRVTSQKLAGRDRSVFSYDDARRTTAISSPALGTDEYGTDALLRTVLKRTAQGSRSFSYSARNQKVQETDTLGSKVSLAYQEQGRLAGIAGPAGAPVRLGYTAEGRLSRVEHAGCAVLALDYDGRGLPVGITGANGQETALAYDGSGQVAKVCDADGVAIALTHDAANRLSGIEDGAGVRTRFTYDALGRVTGVAGAAGGGARLSYDGAHRLTGIADAHGTREYAYDACGNLTHVSSSGGLSLALSYNEANDLISAKDSRGYERCFSYDGAGRMVEVSDGDGVLCSYTYDSQGNTASCTRPGGAEVRLAYDSENNLLSASSSEGAHAGCTYDKAHRRIRMRNAPGYETGLVYDMHSAPICIFDGEGPLVECVRDRAGKVTELKDASGARRLLSWSGAGRLAGVKDCGGAEVGLGYDPAGRLTGIVRTGEGEERAQRVGYDGSGRIAWVEDACGAHTSYTYGHSGRPERIGARDGTSVRLSWDACGRLEAIGRQDGSETRFAFDGSGALAAVASPEGEAAVERHRDGRISGVRCAGASWRYVRDRHGRMTRREADACTPEDFAYTAGGRLASLDKGDAHVGYAYDTYGRLAEKRLGEHISVRYSYDKRNLLTGYVIVSQGTEVFRSEASYDRLGRKVSERTTEKGAARLRTYAYDLQGRISEVAEDGVAVRSYAYDAFGNRTSLRDGRGTTSYTYDACDRLIAEKAPDGETSYAYDACGRLVSYSGGRGEASFSYGARGLLERAAGSGHEVSFAFDALGKRRESRTGSGTAQRMCDPLAPYSDARRIGEDEYLFDAHLCAALGGGGSLCYVATDGLGSPTHVFDGEGRLLERYAYDEFGCEGEVRPGRLVPFGFCGYEHDGTGMLFAQARHYDPRTARFASEDRARGHAVRPDTLNRYAYCTNNPVCLTDRDGREASPASLPDQLWDWWTTTMVGTDTVTVREESGGTYAEHYVHTGGGTFVWQEELRDGSTDPTPTGFTLNLVSFEDFNISLDVTYPGPGEWLPKVAGSYSSGGDGTFAATEWGFSQKGIVHGVETAAELPCVIGYTEGMRAGTETTVMDWAEAGEMVVSLGAVLALAFIVVNDLTGAGVLDNFAIPPLLAIIAQGGTAASAVVSRISALITSPAATASLTACAALK